ncbi:MAG: TonB-dependent receptor plug domain-containing protein [Bacteroidota bacterium]
MVKSLVRTYLFLLILSPLSGLAQVEISDITGRFEALHEQTATEKVYLHTNRDRLALGETLFLSAFVVNGQDHTPTFLSGVLYVDLVSPKEEIVESLKLKIDTLGRSSGSMVLSDSLEAGNYTLRGYTQYQLNFDEDYLFTRTIKLLPRLDVQKVADGSPNKVPQVILQFFPEGGDLVAGTNNFIAFKATDQYGNPIDIKGSILDSSGKVVAPITCEHDGMGMVQLYLNEDKYSCAYEFAGRTFSQPLPPVASKGYLLHVSNVKGRWYAEVKAQNTSIDKSFLMVQSRGKILYVVGPQPNSETIRFSLPQKDLPSGITQLTFFDSQHRAVAERLIYNENPESRTTLQLTTESTSYAKRSKVNLDLKLTNGAGETPELASLSTAVIPRKLYSKPDVSIVSYLLFTSDLKGYIHQPTYYLDRENPERMNHIDLLMMTHGWRRFEWDKVIAGELPELNHFFEQGIRIEGTVTNYVERHRPVVADLELSFPDNLLFKMETTSLENGLFWFDKLKFNDTLTAYVKTVTEITKKSKKDDNNTHIKIHEREIPEIREYFQSPFAITPEDENLIEKGKQLLAFQPSISPKPEASEKAASESKSENADPFAGRQGLIYSEPDHRIMLDSFPQYYRDVFQYLYGVPGLVVTGFAPNASVNIRGAESINSPTSPIYMLDGLERDERFMNNMNVMNILFIDVLKGPSASVYGSRGSNGAICLYSRQAGDYRYVKDQDLVGLAVMQLAGYTPSRAFYMPDYSNPTEEEKIRPDYRSTIYWNPNKIIENGQASDNFYTSDEEGEFIIYSEGITRDGKVFTGEAVYVVK